MLPRHPEQGRGGRGSRGRGGTPPAYTRPVRNPFGDPTYRAQLSRAILGEIERTTGQTPWNNNRGNVPAARITSIRLEPEVVTRGTTPCVNRVITEAPPARAENKAENWHILLNGCADMRTLILNFFIILVVINFALNISILLHLVNIQFF